MAQAKARRGPGRPSKLTAQTTRILTGALRAGMGYEAACRAAGIHYQSFRNWMLRGEAAGKGEYFEFVEAVRDAEQRLEAELVSRLYKAGEKLWMPNTWLLERRFPQRWGKQDRTPLREQVRDEIQRLAAQQGLSPEDTERAIQEAEELVRTRGRG